MAMRLCPEAVHLRYLKGYHQALRENPGLWRFFMVTFVGATLDALTKNGPLLIVGGVIGTRAAGVRSEEHTSELQSLMRISYAVFCLKTKTPYNHYTNTH